MGCGPVGHATVRVWWRGAAGKGEDGAMDVAAVVAAAATGGQGGPRVESVRWSGDTHEAASRPAPGEKSAVKRPNSSAWWDDAREAGKRYRSNAGDRFEWLRSARERVRTAQEAAEVVGVVVSRDVALASPSFALEWFASASEAFGVRDVVSRCGVDVVQAVLEEHWADADEQTARVVAAVAQSSVWDVAVRWAAATSHVLAKSKVDVLFAVVTARLVMSLPGSSTNPSDGDDDDDDDDDDDAAWARAVKLLGAPRAVTSILLPLVVETPERMSAAKRRFVRALAREAGEPLLHSCGGWLRDALPSGDSSSTAATNATTMERVDRLLDVAHVVVEALHRQQRGNAHYNNSACESALREWLSSRVLCAGGDVPTNENAREPASVGMIRPVALRLLLSALTKRLETDAEWALRAQRGALVRLGGHAKQLKARVEYCDAARRRVHGDAAADSLSASDSTAAVRTMARDIAHAFAADPRRLPRELIATAFARPLFFATVLRPALVEFASLSQAPGAADGSRHLGRAFTTLVDALVDATSSTSGAVAGGVSSDASQSLANAHNAAALGVVVVDLMDDDDESGDDSVETTRTPRREDGRVELDDSEASALERVADEYARRVGELLALEPLLQLSQSASDAAWTARVNEVRKCLLAHASTTSGTTVSARAKDAARAVAQVFGCGCPGGAQQSATVAQSRRLSELRVAMCGGGGGSGITTLVHTALRMHVATALVAAPNATVYAPIVQALVSTGAAGALETVVGEMVSTGSRGTMDAATRALWGCVRLVRATLAPAAREAVGTFPRHAARWLCDRLTHAAAQLDGFVESVWAAVDAYDALPLDRVTRVSAADMFAWETRAGVRTWFGSFATHAEWVLSSSRARFKDDEAMRAAVAALLAPTTASSSLSGSAASEGEAGVVVAVMRLSTATTEPDRVFLETWASCAAEGNAEDASRVAERALGLARVVPFCRTAVSKMVLARDKWYVPLRIDDVKAVWARARAARGSVDAAVVNAAEAFLASVEEEFSF